MFDKFVCVARSNILYDYNYKIEIKPIIVGNVYEWIFFYVKKFKIYGIIMGNVSNRYMVLE